MHNELESAVARSDTGRDDMNLACNTITLLPRQIVAGICFHVLDEEIAEVIDAASARCRIATLEREGLRITFTRNEWVSLTHTQRLRWLVSGSETTLSLCTDGVAVLTPMRD